jgi:hypothetical protein
MASSRPSGAPEVAAENRVYSGRIKNAESSQVSVKHVMEPREQVGQVFCYYLTRTNANSANDVPGKSIGATDSKSPCGLLERHSLNAGEIQRTHRNAVVYEAGQTDSVLGG